MGVRFEAETMLEGDGKGEDEVYCGSGKSLDKTPGNRFTRGCEWERSYTVW